ncbi:copper-translocating P-type ATPase [Dysgonomonas gadei]|uniref:Copper-translocating P-type ATPase n=1 Tax=Dysgonomonas gadei ATCC BAA-286 TaxID=742766 RepID=F5IW13_9BACT|nr:copper-translocating P-type ATPase [Dysgonomonas gadei]EGK02813.1 copper-translocating P-type ATPase [Dysgonomonas gadei ATCC BAA-286]
MANNPENILSISDIEKIIEGEDIVDIYNHNLAGIRKNCVYAMLLCIPLLIIAIFFSKINYVNYIMWLLATPVIILFGKQFFIKAWVQIRHFTTNVDTLVALSTGTAYVVSVFNTFYPSFWTDKGLQAHVYFEVSAVIVAFVLLGRYLEYKAKRNITVAIKQLIGLQPDTAAVVKEGQLVKTAIKDIRIGDKIFVKPGERIAVDGKITQGSSFINESMISGEAMPVEKSEGKKVYAGTINEANSFYFEAYKVGKNTLIGQIVKMVQEGESSRLPVSKAVDRVSSIFIPIVGIVAILTFLTWLLLSPEDGFTQGLSSMIAVLIMACPCALGLATPTAIMAGIDNGAANGILIKGDEALENARKLTAVVLDKTGTITEGIFRVTDMKWLTGATPELKGILYGIESYSEHPLADAVKNYIRDDMRIKPEMTVSSLSGRGLMGETATNKYYVGTSKLLGEYNIKILDKEKEWIERETEKSNTIVLFANESSLLAIIAITDAVKETSMNAIERMRLARLKLYMLTGDSKRSADMTARKVGIDTDNVMAGALPAGKAAFVRDLKIQGETVAMTGDGINDVGALAIADVSVAMGKGSEIAMEVAQVTVTSSDLNKLIQTINLSKITTRTIHQNLFWAFIFNAIGIPVAAGILFPVNGFLLDPLFAGIVMALSSVSVICNSLLLRRKPI